MKTKFFRNTAPVIPTGAKRSGGISRLTHNTTIKAAAHVSRFLGKLGMTVAGAALLLPLLRRGLGGGFLGKLGMTVLFMLCVPMVLSAQNGVTVTNLEVGAGTVTFNVSWNADEVPGGKAWVFVDYNDNGVMTRLLVSGATVTSGTATKLDDNDKGAWVINSENDDNFSTTVTLSFTSPSIISGACAYASNYSPEAEYITARTIKFTGTPLYNLVLKNAGNDTIYRTSGADFDIPKSYTLESFTDKTGAPGKIKCIPPATFTLWASASGFCADDAGVTFSLDGTELNVNYQLYRNGTTLEGGVLSGTGNAETFTGSFNVAGEYTAKSVAEGLTCAIAMDGSRSIITYSAITAGAIEDGSTTTVAGTDPDVTVQNSSGALGGSGSFTYLWLRTGMGSSATVTTGDDATSYIISPSDYSTSGTYYFNRYAKDKACTTALWVAASGTYTLTVALPPGVNQPQGNCTFTQPAVVGTFASFPSSYSASTYVTLTDERDNKNYAVVKIGDRWWMAQNLNYQVDLTYWDQHGKPTTSTGSQLALRGGFWCPADGTGTVNQTVCDYWGALYAWETAMMLDGKGTWTETNGGGYCAGAANSSYCQTNLGRSASTGMAIGGRGICPPNWHVPTDNEWAVLLDAMASAPNSTALQTSSTGWLGTDASARGKATCSSGTSSDTNPVWTSGSGTDAFAFRALASDDRHSDGTVDSGRGSSALLWTSTPTDYNAARMWELHYSRPGPGHWHANRAGGYSVRCVMNK